jgi:acid stress-induced BolA-like protein IbaG/YrbA
MEERLKQVLRELGHTDEEIFLETNASGAVGGYIVSDAFRGESQISRQAQLWARLRQTLSPEDIVGVVAILTMTPAEVAED